MIECSAYTGVAEWPRSGPGHHVSRNPPQPEAALRRGSTRMIRGRLKPLIKPDQPAELGNRRPKGAEDVRLQVQWVTQ